MTIDWWQQESGEWVARCSQERSWRHGPVGDFDPMNAPDDVLKAAVTHLKAHRTRTLNVSEHVYWPYRPAGVS